MAILPIAWLVVTSPGCQLESGGIGSSTSTAGASSGDATATPTGSGSMPNTGANDDDTSAGPSGSTTGEPGEWPDEPYQWRKPIRIHPGVNLSEFPVAILLDSDGDLAANALPDGRDLAVMDGDGTNPVPYEIERYDGDDGALTLWVDAGELSADEDTRVYLYYGHEDPPEHPLASDTWPTRFESVWHMDVDEQILRDSTGNAHEANAGGPDSAASSQPGIAGQSADFDGIDDVHDAGDPGDGSLDIGMDSFTVSFWAQTTMILGQVDIPLYKGAATDDETGYGFFFRAQKQFPYWVGCISDSEDQAQHLQIGSTDELTGSGWHHVVMTISRDDNMVRTYRDGMLNEEESLTETEPIDSGNALLFGHPVNLFRGRLDEVRIQRAAVDADWAQAEWTNLSDREAFFTVGPAEERP